MENVAVPLEDHLPENQLAVLRRAAAVSGRDGAELYLVGGTVRDVLSGLSPTDLDVVAVGGPENLSDNLADGLGGEVLSRSEFGTAKLRVQSLIVDLASARKETYQRPGALPSVAPGTIDDDLARRDFTVNAMAVFLQEVHWGELLDLHGGRADLQQKLIRVLHPRSFVDDATRILRALRYAHRLGFKYEDETARLSESGLGYVETISGDRIRQELERMFREPDADRLLARAERSGILKAIHPAIGLGRVAAVEIWRLGFCDFPEIDLWRIALLLADVLPEEASSVIDRLNLNGRQAKVVRDVIAIRNAFDRLEAPGLRPHQVYELLRHREEASVEVRALVAGPLGADKLRQYLNELRYVRPALDGNDLIKLGVPEGPQVGELLSEVLTARLDGLVTTKEEEETMVRRRVQRADGR